MRIAGPLLLAVIYASSTTVSFPIKLPLMKLPPAGLCFELPARIAVLNLFKVRKDGHLLGSCEPALMRVFRSQKRVMRFGTSACFLSLGFFACLQARAQLRNPSSASTPTQIQPEAPKDPLGRTTPRGAVLGFLNVARNGEDELATQYLNTGLRGKAAAVLAHQLYIVLDRRLPPRLNQLSDQAEGASTDPLKPNQELVGIIHGDAQNINIEIFVEQVDRGKSGQVWLFSHKTLDSISRLI